MRVSHETIYTSLFVQPKAILPGELTKHLRTRRARRRPQRRVNPDRDSTQLPEKTPISARPLAVLDRRQPGHWEGDLVRHEALFNRAEVEDLRRCAVAAA